MNGYLKELSQMWKHFKKDWLNVDSLIKKMNNWSTEIRRKK